MQGRGSRSTLEEGALFLVRSPRPGLIPVHEAIVREVPEIICKEDRDQGSGVRDRKNNDLEDCRAG
jgi:hypothetical protein